MESNRSIFRLRFLSERHDDFRDARQVFTSINDLWRDDIPRIRESTLPLPESVAVTTPSSSEVSSHHLDSLTSQLNSYLPPYDAVVNYMRNGQFGVFENLVRSSRYVPHHEDRINRFDVDIQPIDALRYLELRFPLRFPRSITPQIFLPSRTPAEQLAFEGAEDVVTHMLTQYNAYILPIVRGFARGGHHHAAERFVNDWANHMHRSNDPEVTDLRTAMATGYAQAGDIARFNLMIHLGADINRAMYDLALHQHIEPARSILTARPGNPDLMCQFLRGVVVGSPEAAREYIVEQRSLGPILQGVVSSMAAALLSHRRYELINTWLTEGIVTRQEVARAIEHLASFGTTLSEGYHEERLRTFLAFYQTPHAALCDNLELHPIEHARAMTIHSWMRPNTDSSQSAMSFEQAFYISNSHRLTMLVNEMTRENRIGFRDAYLMVSRPEIYQLLVRTDGGNYTNEELIMLRQLCSQAIPADITRHIVSFLLPREMQSVSVSSLQNLLLRQNQRLFPQIVNAGSSVKKRKLDAEPVTSCSAEARVIKRARKK